LYDSRRRRRCRHLEHRQLHVQQALLFAVAVEKTVELGDAGGASLANAAALSIKLVVAITTTTANTSTSPRLCPRLNHHH
jgi:hypothetical protein